MMFLLLAFTLQLLESLAQTPAPAPAVQMVEQMVHAEAVSRGTRQRFLYRRTERSIRTKGHLWDELVVETTDGRMRRLVSVDGKPLSISEQRAENNRISDLVNHPAEFRREAQAQREDEFRLSNLLKQVPKMFLFQMEGTDGDCTRITYTPNPQFQEQSYQDRVVHAMSGVLLIHNTDMRLCAISGHLDHPVEFGFGLLGKVSEQSHFSVVHSEVSPGQWKATKILVHVDGNILFLKSVSRDQNSTHYGFQSVPQDLTVAQAAALVRSTTF